MRLCNDIDICKWESALYSDAVSSDRYVCSGNGGVISGGQFSVTGIDFLQSGVEPGFMLRCWNELAMVELCCEIVEVQSSVSLSVSSVRPSGVTELWPPGDYSNLNFAVISYSPVIDEVSYSIMSRLREINSIDDLVESRSLRLQCVFLVIASVYASIAKTSDDDFYWHKSEYYRKQYDMEQSRFAADIDTDGDGEIDRTICGNIISLKRK